VRLWERYTARRRRKMHERYEQERARQKALNARDTQTSMRDVADNTAITQSTFQAQ
jgi:hypothetical protein